MSAAFRPEAAAAHRVEYPKCDGVIRIIFRSADRYRGRPQTDVPASPAPASAAQAEPGSTTRSGRALVMRERIETGDRLRLTILGDLDVASANAFTARLAELKTAGGPARLDLSQLAFIDSSGIQALLVALADARSTGWQLEVAREVSPVVQRAAQITGIAQILWPKDPDAGPSNASPSMWASTT
jgi:anti-anti-sigma factor